MWVAAGEGFSLGLGLILAIGAQNAFVLRQGIEKQHLLPVVLVCAFSDAILIAAGVAGFGKAAEAIPRLGDIMAVGGAAFLFWYGFSRFRASLHTESLQASDQAISSRKAAVLQCLAFTWLNPHVYLDTLVLVGSAAAQYEPDPRIWFGGGAIAASWVFFFSLGYMAKALSPLLARPAVWRVIEIAIGLMMWVLAAKLLSGLF